MGPLVFSNLEMTMAVDCYTLSDTWAAPTQRIGDGERWQRRRQPSEVRRLYAERFCPLIAVRFLISHATASLVSPTAILSKGCYSLKGEPYRANDILYLSQIAPGSPDHIRSSS